MIDDIDNSDIHKTGDSREDVAHVLEPAEIDRIAPGDVAGERESGTDGQTSDDKADHDEERDHTRRPGEADDWDQALE